MADRLEDVAVSDRHVAVATFTAAAVDSFLKRREQRDPFSERTSAQALWGVAARSSVPVIDARARFDYSLYLPDGAAPFQGSGPADDEEQHLLRFGLEDRFRFMEYGGSLFTVDDAFASQPLAQERMAAAGLPGPGAGNELWAKLALPLGLRPSFRRVAVDTEIGGADLMRHTSTTTFGVTSPLPRGSLFLRNVRFQEQTSAAEAASTSRFRWELGGSLNAFGSTRVSPLFAREQQFDGSVEAWESWLTGVDVHTRLLDATVLDLHLHQHRHENPFSAPEASVAARLALTTPLRPWARTPPGLKMTAAVGYLDRTGTDVRRPDEGMSVRLSFTYHAGG